MQNENGVPEEDTVEYYLSDTENVDIVLQGIESKL